MLGDVVKKIGRTSLCGAELIHPAQKGGASQKFY